VGLQSFFADCRFLGSREIEDTRLVPGLEVIFHHSYAYFCLHCGDIWGRLHHDKARLTQVVCRPCGEHGDGRLATPPEWTDVPTAWTENWPEAAYRREFLCNLALAERGEWVAAGPRSTLK
jgi:hypothetical protein